jgi:hypothetical protein
LSGGLRRHVPVAIDHLTGATSLVKPKAFT